MNGLQDKLGANPVTRVVWAPQSPLHPFLVLKSTEHPALEYASSPNENWDEKDREKLDNTTKNHNQGGPNDNYSISRVP
jgi:hypothetical protein